MSDVSYMNRRKRFTLIGTLTLVIGFWVGWGLRPHLDLSITSVSLGTTEGRGPQVIEELPGPSVSRRPGLYPALLPTGRRQNKSLTR